MLLFVGDDFSINCQLTPASQKVPDKWCFKSLTLQSWRLILASSAQMEELSPVVPMNLDFVNEEHIIGLYITINNSVKYAWLINRMNLTRYHTTRHSKQIGGIPYL